jgi:hypothetical protein
MRTQKNALTYLLGVAAAAMIVGGCTVTVTTEPSSAPPPPPTITATCGPGLYAQGGQYVWQRGKYVWRAPTCVSRPASWREGCIWRHGAWAKSGNRWVYQDGSLYCPPVPVEPTAEPPEPPTPTVTCGPSEYLKGGQHHWRNGAWVWDAPVCVARPATWAEGCKWTYGRWARVGSRLVYNEGRLVCPSAPPPPPPRVEPVYATELPPPPPKAYRPVKCVGAQIAYPGRYIFNSTTKVWDWRPGVCIDRAAEYKTCKLVAGHYVTHEGRVHYVLPSWACRGKPTVYVTAKGNPWTPPETHKVFIGWKPCPAVRVHDAAGKCGLPPCPTGTVRRSAWCVAPPAPLAPCPEGTVRRGKACVAPKAPLAPCPEGTVRKGKACVAPKAPPPPCPEGTVRRGKACVKVRGMAG